MADDLTAGQILRDAGYSHRRVSGHGQCRREITRISDGSLVGYMTASEACDFLGIAPDRRLVILPHLRGFMDGED